MGFKQLDHYYKSRCNLHHIGLNGVNFDLDKVNFMRFNFDGKPRKQEAKLPSVKELIEFT